MYVSMYHQSHQRLSLAMLGVVHIIITGERRRPSRRAGRERPLRTSIFFYITQNNVPQYVCTLIPMNTRTQTLPLWAPPKNWTGKSWSSQSHHRRLAVDGNVAYNLMHSAGKSWNKSRKIRTPVSSRGLEPWWAGFTTRNPTNWSMIRSRHRGLVNSA
jgi:hypothetical protein